MHKTIIGLVAGAVLATCDLASAASAAPSGATPLAEAEAPTAAEKNPRGDIPDNQAFTDYRSPLGFSIKVPEGWARREASHDVAFSDKYHRLHIAVESQTTEPSVASVRANQAGAPEKSGKAVRVTAVKSVELPASASNGERSAQIGAKRLVST